MTSLKKSIVYIILCCAVFYLIPLIKLDKSFAVITLLLITPVCIGIISLFCGINKGFIPLYPLVIAGLFVISAFIFYNETASFYALTNGIIAFGGNILGYLIYKKKRRKK